MQYSISLLIIVNLILFSCKGNSESKEARNLETSGLYNDSVYPEEVIKRGLEKEYDSAKFNFYLLSAFDTPRVRYNGIYAFEPAKPLSAYPVIMDTIIDNNESQRFIFSFIINGEKMIDSLSWGKEVNFVEAVYQKPSNEGKEIMTCVQTRGYSDACPDMIEICFSSFEDLQSLKISADSIDRIFSMIYGRLAYLENPKTLSFIQSNHKDLNPWFVKMARQRGVIKD